MAVREHMIDIPGRLTSAAIERHVAGDDQIYDDDWEETQYQINRRLKGLIDSLSSGLTTLGNTVNNLSSTVNSQGDSINNLVRAINTTNSNVSGLSSALNALANRVTNLEDLWQKVTISGATYVKSNYRALAAGMYDSTV